MKENNEIYNLSESEMKFYQDFVNNTGNNVGSTAKLYKFPEPIDIRRLADAIGVAFNAHKAFSLRIFLDEQGEPQQYIDENYRFEQSVEIMDDEQFDTCKSQLQEKFMFFNEPLFHSRLIQTQSAVYWFLDIHHVVVDANSRLVLYDDITRAYNKESLLAEDWNPCNIAEHERQVAGTENYKSSLASLQKQWCNFEACYPCPDICSEHFSMMKKFVDLDIDMKAIKTFTDATGCSLSALGAAVCCLLLSFYTEKQNAAIITAFNCRNRPEVERTVGMVTKYLLFSLPWKKEMSPAVFSRCAMTATMSGRDNIDASFAAMRSINGSFFEFIFQGSMLEKIIRPFIVNQHAQIQSLSLDGHADMKPFNVHFLISSGKAKLMFLCHGNKYSEQFVEQFAKNYERILRMLPFADNIGDILRSLQK